MLWRSSGSMTGAQGLGDLVLGGHPVDCGKRMPRHDTGGARRPRRLREERYYYCRRDIWAGSLTPRSRPLQAGAGGSVDYRLLATVERTSVGPTLDVGASRLELGLDVLAGRLHLRLDVAAVTPHEALSLRPVALQLTLQLVASGVAATLELAQVGRDALLEAGDLALRAVTAGVRLHVLDHVVADREGRADGDEDGALGLKSEGLDARSLSLGARGCGVRSAARGRAGAAAGGASTAARGGALAGRGGLLGGGAPLRGGLCCHLILPGGISGD